MMTAFPSRSNPLRSAALAAVLTLVAGAAQAGPIVVNNDEWSVSDFGFTQAGATNARAFSQNLASFLDTDGVAGGNVLIFSSNFGLTGQSFSGALTAAGYAPTTSTAISFDLPTLMTFDVIFLAGPAPVDFAVLSSYVSGGGGVYIAAGTAGFGGPATEAAFWNPFLNTFGLQFADIWDPSTLGLIDPVQSGHPLFAGVEQLYYDFGNPVLGTALEFNTSGVGLIGIFNDVPSAVPEPDSVTLVLLGLGALAFWHASHRVFNRRGPLSTIRWLTHPSPTSALQGKDESLT
jgi:hypothetical protein